MSMFKAIVFVLAALLMTQCAVPKIRTFYRPQSQTGAPAAPGEAGHLIQADAWTQEVDGNRCAATLRPLGSDKLRLDVTLTLPRTPQTGVDPGGFRLVTGDGAVFRPAKHQSRTWYADCLDPERQVRWTIQHFKLVYHTGNADLLEVDLFLEAGAVRVSGEPVPFDVIRFQKRTGFDVFYTPFNR